MGWELLKERQKTLLHTFIVKDTLFEMIQIDIYVICTINVAVYQ